MPKIVGPAEARRWFKQETSSISSEAGPAMGFAPTMPVFFRLPVAARRSRLPPILWRIFYEYTLPALAFDSCRVGVSDLWTFRGCCGRDHPDQGADQAVPSHRQGCAQSSGQERRHEHHAPYA